MSQILLPFEALREKGITLGKTQIWRLEKNGKFPRRIYPSAGRVAWIESEIDAYMAGRVTKRERSVPAQFAAAQVAA